MIISPLSLDTARDIPTPEGIAIRLQLAGPVVRGYAWLLDVFIRGVLYTGLSIAFAFLGDIGTGLSLIAFFLGEWLLPAFFEVWKGATPGKIAFKLRVLHTDGTPVGWRAALIRNLLRTADFLPFLYMFGLLSMLMSRDFQRLGDLAAGTLVVYKPQPRRNFDIPAEMPVMPRYTLGLTEQRAVIDFAARFRRLTEARADELARLTTPLIDPHSDPSPATQLVQIANGLLGRAK